MAKESQDLPWMSIRQNVIAALSKQGMPTEEIENMIDNQKKRKKKRKTDKRKGKRKIPY